MSRLYTVAEAAEKLREANARNGDRRSMYVFAIGMIGVLVGIRQPCEDRLADIAAVVEALDVVEQDR